MILWRVWVVGSDWKVFRPVGDCEACKLRYFMFIVGVSQVAKIMTTLFSQRLDVWYMCVSCGGGGYCGHF